MSEQQQPAFVRCVRVRDVAAGVKPIEGSEVIACAGCNAEIYITQGSIEAAQEHKATAVCDRCWLYRLALSDGEAFEIPHNAKQQAELEAFRKRGGGK